MTRPVILIGSLILAVVALAGTRGIYWIAKRAEPPYHGRFALPGLAAAVHVHFGPGAVPTIEAENIHDLLFAQGYIVARERMWQMDLLRRVAGGRLAEWLGPMALPADRLFRTLGLDVEAGRSLAALDEADRAMLRAYSAGVNAYQAEAQAGWRLPLEYLIARVRPVPWTPEDSLLIGGYMAWVQSYNLRGELTFLRLAARIGPERARELFPVDADIPAPTVAPELTGELARNLIRGSQGGGGALTIEPALRVVERLGLPLPAPASNGWAVTGARTRTGAALLANDPHLAPSMPGIWYELELNAPGLQAAGVSLPGVPLVMIGHNRDLAWGFTSTMADTQDLFVERLVADGQHVERPDGGQERIRRRTTPIAVMGAEPVDLVIRSTRHGVIVNDILGPSTNTPMDLPSVQTRHLLALRRTTDLPDRAFAGLVRLNRASTLADAAAAVLDFRHVALTLLLAHRDGGIGLQISGLLPQRGEGSGAFPSPGWEGGYAWRGLIPQALNPRILGPAGSALITANNRIVPPDYPIRISNAWMAPFRAERIAERLAAAGPLTPTDMAEIQSDRLSILARLTQRSLRTLESELRAVDADAWSIAAEELLDWDGEMAGASRSAALFALLEPALLRALYEDELGADLEVLADMGIFAYSPLFETLRTGRSSFWDDVTTPAIERPAEIWARALVAAMSDLLARTGTGGEDVRLDRVRTLTFPHAFRDLPLLGRLFNVGPLGLGGHSDTINVVKSSPLTPETVIFIPSMRVVQTPADWRRTRGTLPLGQSGHLFSPYRDDQLEDWLSGRHHAWPWNGPIGGPGIGHVLLTPAR